MGDCTSRVHSLRCAVSQRRPLFAIVAVHVLRVCSWRCCRIRSPAKRSRGSPPRRPAAPPAASDSPGRVEGKAPAPTGSGRGDRRPRTADRTRVRAADGQAGDGSGGPDVRARRAARPDGSAGLNSETATTRCTTCTWTTTRAREPAFNVAHSRPAGPTSIPSSTTGSIASGATFIRRWRRRSYSSTTPFVALAEPGRPFRVRRRPTRQHGR